MLVPPLKCAFALIQSSELMPQCVLERIILLQAVQLNRRDKFRERLLQLNPAALTPAAPPAYNAAFDWALLLGFAASVAAGSVPVASAPLRAEKALLNTLSLLLSSVGLSPWGAAGKGCACPQETEGLFVPQPPVLLGLGGLTAGTGAHSPSPATETTGWLSDYFTSWNLTLLTFFGTWSNWNTERTCWVGQN